MIQSMIAEVLKERKRIVIETGDNWQYGIEQCHEKCLQILSKDVDRSIDYFLHVCSDEEYFWLSETFEELMIRTRSQKLLDALYARRDRIRQAEFADVDLDLACAEGQLDFILHPDKWPVINVSIAVRDPFEVQ